MVTGRSDSKEKGEQAGASMGRRAGEAFDSARDAAFSATDKLQQGAEGIGRRIQDTASNAAESLRESASAATQRVGEAYQATTETISEFGDDVMKLIRRHPFQSTMICFGAGCLFGALALGGLFAVRRD